MDGSMLERELNTYLEKDKRGFPVVFVLKWLQLLQLSGRRGEILKCLSHTHFRDQGSNWTDFYYKSAEVSLLVTYISVFIIHYSNIEEPLLLLPLQYHPFHELF